MKNSFEISINSGDIKTTVEISDESSIDDVLNAITGLLMINTFLPTTIYNGMLEFASRHKELMK